MEREKGNGQKWRENKEIERDLLSTFPHFLFISSLYIHFLYQTLPKALRTQALTALTNNFGLVGLVQYAWQATFNLVW